MSDSTWSADGRIWQTIQPPLVPTEEDIRLVMEAARPTLERAVAAPRILVLGMTSALLDAPWPAGSGLHAVDYDRLMIDLFWKDGPGRQCHCARWQNMPLEDDMFDLVLGDCSFNALPDIADYAEVLREIARVSRPGAPVIARFFMQPEPRLTLAAAPELVAREFAASPSAPIRLLLFLAAAGDDGTLRFRDVADRVVDAAGDFDAYLAALGQAPADIARARAVLKSDQRLNYPSKAQILREFEPFYADAAFEYPSYDVGRYCPVVRFS